MLAGLLMVLVSVTKLSRFITLLPSPVMLGFCNGLAIVIGLSQLHPFEDHETHHWKEGSEMMWMLIICFTAMIIMECLPKLPFKIFKVDVSEQGEHSSANCHSAANDDKPG